MFYFHIRQSGINSFSLPEVSIIINAIQYENGCSVLFTQKKNEEDYHVFILLGLLPTKLPKFISSPGDAVAKPMISVMDWLNFMEKRGLNNEFKQEKREEVEMFLRLPLVKLSSFQKGDIILCKIYKKKEKIGDIEKSIKYVNKNFFHYNYSSRFSTHLYIVINAETFAHMFEPFCEVIPAVEQHENISLLKFDNCCLVYRFSDINLANKMADVAYQRASLPEKQKEQYFGGIFDRKQPHLAKIPDHLPLLKSTEYIARYRQSKAENRSEPIKTSKSWCTKWVLDVLQKAIVETVPQVEQDSYRQILESDSHESTSKSIENSLNLACIKGKSNLLGKSYVFGFPLASIRMQHKDIKTNELMAGYKKEEANFLRSSL